MGMVHIVLHLFYFDFDSFMFPEIEDVSSKITYIDNKI